MQISLVPLLPPTMSIQQAGTQTHIRRTTLPCRHTLWQPMPRLGPNLVASASAFPILPRLLPDTAHLLLRRPTRTSRAARPASRERRDVALQLALGRNGTGRACQRSQVGMEAVGRKVEVRGRGLEVRENVGMLGR
jgi:hypothetical protein